MAVLHRFYCINQWVTQDIISTLFFFFRGSFSLFFSVDSKSSLFAKVLIYASPVYIEIKSGVLCLIKVYVLII